MKASILIVAGVVFCAAASFLADTALWVAAVSESWVPYVAVPFAMGLAAPKIPVVRAGLLGALSSALMVIGFYGVRPFDTGDYSISMTDIYYWGAIGLVTGWTLAAIARALAPRVVSAPWRWLLGCCSLLALAHAADNLYTGWGVHAVTTSSGLVHIGASTTDVVVSTIVVLGFGCGAIATAIAPLAAARRRLLAAAEADTTTTPRTARFARRSSTAISDGAVSFQARAPSLRT